MDCVPASVHKDSELLMNLPEETKPGTFPISCILENFPRLGQLIWDVDIPKLNKLGLLVLFKDKVNRKVCNVNKDPKKVAEDVMWFLGEVGDGKDPNYVIKTSKSIFTFQHLENALCVCKYLLISDYIPYKIRSFIHSIYRYEKSIRDIMIALSTPYYSSRYGFGEPYLLFYKREEFYSWSDVFRPKGVAIIEETQTKPRPSNETLERIKTDIKESEDYQEPLKSYIWIDLNNQLAIKYYDSD